jgi:hypothetical protein
MNNQQHHSIPGVQDQRHVVQETSNISLIPRHRRGISEHSQRETHHKLHKEMGPLTYSPICE